MSYEAHASITAKTEDMIQPGGWDQQFEKGTEGYDEEEKLRKEYLLCLDDTTLTDRSMGKRPTSPSQTTDGKSLSSPLKAAALPKNIIAHFRRKIVEVTGKKNVYGYPLKIFKEPVFKTDKLLAFKHKIVMDNVLQAFYEEDEEYLLRSLNALTEELYGVHAKEK